MQTPTEWRRVQVGSLLVGLFSDEVSARLRSGWVIAIFSVLAACAYLGAGVVIGSSNLYPLQPLTLDDPHLLFTSLELFIAGVLPTLFCALVLKARVGLPRAGAAKHLGLGLVLGAAALSLSVLIPLTVGQGELTPFEGRASGLWLSAARQLLTLGPTAIGEELLLRGVVLRELAAGTRPWFAVAATGSLFGMMHLFNPSASVIAALNIALVGVWFGALALRTSLWTSIAAHLAWNWFEGFVYGLPVSGITPGRALFLGTVREWSFFSGGQFGPEASGLTTVVLTAATLATVLWSRRRPAAAG